ncbi:hypothetical protein TIFTF001_029418 [Ficus carica]|uniref:Uncharacterized protein n=1 Tax=Ficus carica TaxID=3494 RepID=A0AA88DSD9_FICCA|nr:hypothetical protein TIFTF001_029418 [Ficus carica]
MEKQRSRSPSRATRGSRALSRSLDDACFSDLRRCGGGDGDGDGNDFKSFTNDLRCRQLDYPELDHKLQSMCVSRISSDIGTVAARRSFMTRSLVIWLWCSSGDGNWRFRVRV